MNEDIYKLSLKEGMAELIKLFKEFEFSEARVSFRLVKEYLEEKPFGEEVLMGEVEFFYPEIKGISPGLAKQEFVDFEKADRLEKLLLEFGDVRI